MQSIPILRSNIDTSQNVMKTFPKLRSNIDTIQNNAIINIQNAIRNKIAKTKVKSVIQNRDNEYQNARNALIKSMQNTIMAQGIVNELIDTAANKGDINIKQKAATKIQDVFKKLKEKSKDKKDLIRRLSREQLRRLDGAEAYKQRLIIEQEKLLRYSNDSPKKFALMEKQIEKTNKQIEFYTKQANFIADKIAKL
jgi:hypothetical protein